MPIPETQLQTWSNIGATDSPQKTHTSIRTALDSFKNWQSNDVIYDPYLSGSYGNNTNIHGNSDVDLVVELTSIEYSNLTENEKSELRKEPTTYSWFKFRQDVITALVNHYGTDYVDTTGIKSVKVLPASGRQKADVVISASYKYYENLKVRENGIIFWTQREQKEIINYPKAHLNNGVNKNADDKTRGWYKKTIRIYKNARDRIVENNPHFNNRFPSYFIENLLYNVPDNQFGGTCQQTFINPLNWLNGEVSNDHAGNFICQNGMYYLFRNTPVTWNITDAKEYLTQLTNLWEKW